VDGLLSYWAVNERRVPPPPEAASRCRLSPQGRYLSNVRAACRSRYVKGIITGVFPHGGRFVAKRSSLRLDPEDSSQGMDALLLAVGLNHALERAIKESHARTRMPLANEHGASGA